MVHFIMGLAWAEAYTVALQMELNIFLLLPETHTGPGTGVCDFVFGFLKKMGNRTLQK